MNLEINCKRCVYAYSLCVCDNGLLAQQLTNKVFEDLAADVYDEVDRRETDASEPFPPVLHSPHPLLLQFGSLRSRCTVLYHSFPSILLCLQ